MESQCCTFKNKNKKEKEKSKEDCIFCGLLLTYTNCKY